MKEKQPPGMTNVLEGVRILDLTRNIAGPVATMFAAEMGADVIKVEPPGGDEMRTWPPFDESHSVYFLSCNRGKRSIAIDLKSTEGKSLFRRLLPTVDILVENYRPGTLEGLGIGWENIKEDHPRLVWVSVTGYGRQGPAAAAPAYDSMMQAFAGIMGITGERGGAPVRSGGSPIDIATSYLAWGAMITGWHTAKASGKGVLMEVSLMESSLGFMHAYLQAALANLSLPGRMGSETMGMYPMGAFRTGDGQHCLLQVSNDHQWRRLCEALGAGELIADARFETNPLRVQHREDLRPLLAEYMLLRGAREWEQKLQSAGIPAAHVKSPWDVVTNEQVLARSMVKTAMRPDGRAFETWGVPVKMNQQLASRMLTVPALDQHRSEILSELGRLESMETNGRKAA
jgi:crotonobetainyl-CoA:carnitine CoA-transferase CaiB-like acyl-CoA transferase